MTFSIESRVGDLLDNQATKDILEKHIPGISSHPQLGMARGMSLTAVATFAAGQIPPETLNAIDAELKNIV